MAWPRERRLAGGGHEIQREPFSIGMLRQLRFAPGGETRGEDFFFKTFQRRDQRRVTEAQFRSELSALAERLSREYGENVGWTSVTTAPID